MALPRKARPEYSTTIPSTGKKVKYNPFTVREEKVLILAAEGESPDEIANAITNVLESCVTSPSDFSVSELALFDIEYLFLKARAKSVGEKIELRITDPSDSTYTVDHAVNIDSIKVTTDEKHSDLVTVSDEVKIKMRYPGVDFFADGLQVDNVAESTKTVARCVSSIVIGEDVYARADMTDTEIQEWLEDLTTAEYAKILEFFRTMPKLQHTIKLKNKKTGNPFSITLTGLSDFF